MKHPFALTLGALAATWVIIAPISAQTLEDLLIANEQAAAQIAPPNAPIGDLDDRHVTPPVLAGNIGATNTEFNASLFSYPMKNSPQDALADGIRFLAYLQWQIANTPQTPMSLNRFATPLVLDSFAPD